MTTSGVPPIKRYRREKSASEGSDSESSGPYVPYVSVRDRRKQQLARLGHLEKAAQLVSVSTNVSAPGTEPAIETKSSSDNDHDDEGEFTFTEFNLSKSHNFF